MQQEVSTLAQNAVYYKKSGWANHEGQSSKWHSKASASVPDSKFFPQVPALTSLDVELQAVRWNKPLSPNRNPN